MATVPTYRSVPERGRDCGMLSGKGMFWLTTGFGDGENGPEACMETERRRAMARIQGQVVGGAVKSVSHRESKFLSLSFSARSI